MWGWLVAVRLLLSGPASVNGAGQGLVFAVVLTDSGGLIYSSLTNDMIDLCRRVERNVPVRSDDPRTCLAAFLRCLTNLSLFLQVVVFVAYGKMSGQGFPISFRRDTSVRANLNYVASCVLYGKNCATMEEFVQRFNVYLAGLH